jgi:hypothetical protein
MRINLQIAAIWALAVVACLLLQGCSLSEMAGRPEPWVSQDEVKAALSIATSSQEQGGGNAQSNANMPIDLIKEYMRAGNAPEARKDIRNRYLVASMLLIDAEYDKFVLHHGGVRKAGDTFAQSAAVTVAAAGAAFSDEVTKTVLSLVSGSIIAMNAAINKNYFYEQSFPMLLKQMEADRKEALLAILRSHTKPDDEYDLMAAHQSLRDFYHAGTFEGAFTKLDQAAASNKERAEADTKKFVKPDPFLSILAWLEEAKDETARQQRVAQLEAKIMDLDGMGFTNADKKAFVWLSKTSYDNAMKAANLVGAPEVSEAQKLARQAVSRQRVESLEFRREQERKKILELGTTNIQEARIMVADAVLAASQKWAQDTAKGLKPAMVPLVNLAQYASRNGGDASLKSLQRPDDDVAPLLKWVMETATKEQLAEAMAKLQVLK